MDFNNILDYPKPSRRPTGTAELLCKIHRYTMLAVIDSKPEVLAVITDLNDVHHIRITTPDDKIYRCISSTLFNALYILRIAQEDEENVTPYDVFMGLAKHYGLSEYQVLVDIGPWPDVRNIKVQ